MKIRPAAALAAAAVLVALPRYMIAQRFADGQVAPTGPVWSALVDGSAAAWALLEALTLAYVQTIYGATRNPNLKRWSYVVIACIALVSAPTIVAVSAGLTLTELLGVASPWHWLWSATLTGSYALIVTSAFAADAAARPVDALIDALDARQPPQAIAAQQVTVNVSREAPPEATGARSSPVERVSQLSAPTKRTAAQTEQAIAAALAAGMTTSPAIAAQIGKSTAWVKRSNAWRAFREAAK